MRMICSCYAWWSWFKVETFRWQRIQRILRLRLSVCLDTLPHVLFQGRRDTERHATESTPVNVLSKSAMGLHVTSKFTWLCTCIRAKFTFVRLFSSMWSTVHRQIGTVLKDLPTIFARIIPSRPSTRCCGSGIWNGTVTTVPAIRSRTAATTPTSKGSKASFKGWWCPDQGSVSRRGSRHGRWWRPWSRYPVWLVISSKRRAR